MSGVPFRFAPLPPRVATDRYEVGDVIASGGMGVVHRAFDKLGQRSVAYKRLGATDATSRPRMAALFQREYDTLLHLTHPHIVRAFDYGFDACGPYYTMELLEGSDCGKLGPLPVAQACLVMRDVASALSLLTARRLVHRDLSPRNVFLAREGGAKLIDFGVMTSFGRAQETVGTAPFVAPECLLEGELDQRTDLFGLGALAYFLLTGRTHTTARSMEALAASLSVPVPAPSRYAPDVPKALDDLVLSLLAPDARLRPASAAQVIEQLTTLAQLGAEPHAEEAALSYLRHPPLVGRDVVLTQLEEALFEALRGRGQIALVEAEQGLGRSALLEQVCVRAQLAGATVLRCVAADHTKPFGSVQELLQPGLALFPGLVEQKEVISAPANHNQPRPPGAPLRTLMEASDQQTAAAERLERTLITLSGGAPLVLVVDDAHALDASSANFLASQCKHIGERPIFLLLSAQRGERREDGQAWAKLTRSAALHELRPLDAKDLSQLVHSVFGDVPNSSNLSAWLFSQTAGAPGHALDLLRLLLTQGLVRYAHGTFTLAYEFSALAPPDQRRALLSRLSQVSALARELCSSLALRRGTLSARQLASAHEGALPDVVSALSELTQRGVVRAEGDTYACASEVLRSAVLSALSKEEARARHAALARALETGETDLDTTCAVVEHLLQADEASQLRAARALAGVTAEQMFELAMQRSRVPLVEASLAILERSGHSDVDCSALLVTLCLSGYFRDPSMQRRYRERTLFALSQICGFHIARRLAPWLGPRLALYAGLLCGLLRHVLRPGKLSPHSFTEHVASFAAATGTATAAAACTFDAAGSRDVLVWLEPLAVAPRRSPLFVMREICVATSELVSARFKSSVQRYQNLLQAPKLRGLAGHHAEQIRSGCLNGLAQALVSELSPAALEWADRSDREASTSFYAPHAEGVRAVFRAYRGEAPRAQRHRERAEALALKSGTCWTSTSVLSARLILPYALTGDVLGLNQVISDLASFARESSSLAALRELARAHVALLRDDPKQALAAYESIFAGPGARCLPTYPADRSFQVLALLAVGKKAAARDLGAAILEELERESGAELSELLYCIVNIALARAEAVLGDHASALRRLQGCMARDLPDSPLLVGSLHRECAYVAVASGDAQAFESHSAAMSAHFLATQNPLLAQQCAALRSEALRLALCDAPTSANDAGQTVLDLSTWVERKARGSELTRPRAT